MKRNNHKTWNRFSILGEPQRCVNPQPPADEPEPKKETEECVKKTNVKNVKQEQ